MRDCSHDEAMADLFLIDPSYAAELLTEVRRDGDTDELAVHERQLSFAFAVKDT
jgi:DNA-binding phage protein